MTELEFFLLLAIRQERCGFTPYISISCLHYTEHFTVFGFELYQSGLEYIKSDKEMSLHYILHHINCTHWSYRIQLCCQCSVLSQRWRKSSPSSENCGGITCWSVISTLPTVLPLDWMLSTFASLLSSDHGSHSTPAVFGQCRAVSMTCVKRFTGPMWPWILCASLQPPSGKMKSAQAVFIPAALVRSLIHSLLSGASQSERVDFFIMKPLSSMNFSNCFYILFPILLCSNELTNLIILDNLTMWQF